MFDFIINPETDRKVYLNSDIGRNILNNYIIQLGGGRFKDMRNLLDDIPMSSIKRGAEYFRPQEGEKKYDKPSGRIISNLEKTEERIKLVSEFPNAVIDIMTFDSIDQKSEGACSFVGFFKSNKF